MSIENPNFLKKKYDLHNSPEVDSAAKRTEARSGESVPQDPSKRIQNYLDRFKEITEHTDPDKRERGMDTLKHVLHDKFIIKPQDIPQSYFETQRRLAREQGHGDVEITEGMRQQLSETIITDQTTTLDSWINYLSSKDATYLDWLKYYAFRSVLGLSSYDKEKHEFSKRGKGTTAPFPDLNREALAYVLDAIEKKYEGKTGPLENLQGEEQKQFEKLLQGENFGKLYAWAIEKVTPASIDQLTITTGQWVKYNQGSDHMPLVQSLQGHGTGWCTAGESTAEAQLKNGDFYVYYSHDPKGKASIPRAAIRIEGEHIAEVRGIAHEQNLDPYIGGVVQEKLKDFGPEGEAYRKKSADMKQLTSIDNKAKKGLELTKDELVFLYEINDPIEGFGYRRDPRIGELRKARNPREDAPVIFECTADQIAWSADQVNENTTTYIGPLYPDIFRELHHLDYLYTSFPEDRVRINRASVEIGTLSKEHIEQGLEQSGFDIAPGAWTMLRHNDFTIVNQPEHLDLFLLTVRNLGFPKGVETTKELYQRARELGLDLCPAEVAPHLLMKEDSTQNFGKRFSVAMKQIDIGINPVVFYLNLENRWFGFTDKGQRGWWNPEDPLLFCLRKQ